MTCVHDIVIAYKHLFECESVRDPVDLLRSLLVMPLVVILDDACGVATHIQTNYPALAQFLWGDRWLT